MKRLKIITIPALVIMLALVLVVGPAFADHGDGSAKADTHGTSESTDNSTGSGDSGSGDSNTTDSGGSDSSKSDGSGKSEDHNKTETESDNKGNDNGQEREHVCQTRKQGLETKFSHIAANSESIDSRITKVFNEAVAYQSDNGINVNDFDSLVNDAQIAKAQADADVSALQSATPTLDCNNVSVASDVSSFKDTAAKTRDSLKAYRDSVVKILQALLRSKDSNTGGSNQ